MNFFARIMLRIPSALGCFSRARIGAHCGNKYRLAEHGGLEIELMAFDRLDQEVIGSLANGLEGRFNCKVSVSYQGFELYAFQNFDRNQCKSSDIIEWLENGKPQGDWHAASRVLAVTTRDLYSPILTFVFGEARLNGQCAVVSSHRLDNSAYGLPRDQALLSARLLKECIHELGHTFGLIHCHDPECVMKSSTCVEQIDLKSSFFCDRCLGELSHQDAGKSHIRQEPLKVTR
jgi:archaemetzincin